MLWKTLFAIIVELDIRSGLFTAEELASSLDLAPPGRSSVPSEDQLQEEHEREPPSGQNACHELGEEMQKLNL